MKKYLIIFMFSVVMLNVFSQQQETVDNKTSHKLNKQQRIERRKTEEAHMALIVDSIVNQRKFVLEATYLSNQTGRRILVNDMLNFIIVDSSRITIQIASNTRAGGANGMGGITATGKISSFEVKKTGKGAGYYFIKLNAQTPVGNYDIFLNVSPSSNADATISGNTSGKLNYFGVVKPLNESRVYKARSI